MSYERLSENIRNYRKMKKLTQKQLAETVFVAPQTISKWESGLASPDVEKLCNMADVFGISLDALIRGASETSRSAYIAIDGGGTKTAFVLFSEDGEVIERVTLGGTNPNTYGLDVSKKILLDGIDMLLLSGATVNGLYAGISGVSVGENKAALQRFLRDRYPYFKSRVEGDIYNVIHSAGDVDRCVAVISGTGSVVYGYDGKELHRAGGWGYLFDEAGSGFDMGRELFRYCLACEDGVAEKSELYHRVSEAVGGVVFDNLSVIYAKGKDYIASFAPVVFEFCQKGDLVAVEIVNKTVDRLAELITLVSRQYDCGNHVVISGGITSCKDILEPLLSARLNKGLKLIIPQMPPIYGAAIRCLKLFGGEYDAELFEKKFARSIER